MYENINMAVHDPLGASLCSAQISMLTRWNDTSVPEYDVLVDDPSNKKESAFKYNENLNEKIILWRGDIFDLNTEAIVNSTNETMNDNNSISEKIILKAGADLRREIKSSLKICRTGEAKLSKGYRLAARYVIHTVGPKYNIKYRTAAESALYSCYRNVLYLVREHNIVSLALASIHSLRRGYPPHEGAHIAIRTVRRFLEKYGDAINTIVFTVSSEDEEVYQSLLPLYFPRSKSEEEFTAYHLPYDIGNEDGEPIIEERQIRIAGKPVIPKYPSRLNTMEDFEQSVNINEAFQTSINVGEHSFSKMESDVDRKRRNRSHNQQKIYVMEKKKRYERRLRTAHDEDLTDFAAMRFLYWSGFDKYDRKVIVCVAKHFPANTINYRKALLYIIHTLDPIVDRPYVIVYFHSQCGAENTPDTQFFKDVYNIVDERYIHNLQAIYMVHTSIWSKLMTWFFTTFSLSDIKSKVHYIPGLEYLYSRIPSDQLDLPQFIAQHDIEENGIRYYNPDEDQAIGSL